MAVPVVEAPQIGHDHALDHPLHGKDDCSLLWLGLQATTQLPNGVCHVAMMSVVEMVEK